MLNKHLTKVPLSVTLLFLILLFFILVDRLSSHSPFSLDPSYIAKMKIKNKLFQKNPSFLYATGRKKHQQCKLFFPFTGPLSYLEEWWKAVNILAQDEV